MVTVAEEPPQDPEEWSEEEWRAWLAQAPPDPDTGRAHPLTRATSTPTGAALGAAMLGLDQAIFGERPKAEIVAEADADGSDEGDLELDLDDPGASWIVVEGD